MRRTLLASYICLAAGLAAADEKPASGRVLILENDRTLEGDIQRHGDQYCLRRTIGETWIPADQVVSLCPNHEEAYRFLRARANLADPDERLRLARWCQKHNLRERAAEEAGHAVRLRPEHAESRRLLQHLQRPPTSPGVAPATRKPDADSDTAAPPPVELTTESLSTFTTRVQPILMNACASCHATGRGGTFKLVRGAGGASASLRIVQQNLAAVLPYVQVEQPHLSPLLVKALSAHGESDQAPLKGRQVAAYQTLENWVRATVRKNPHLRDQSDKGAPTPPAAEAKPEAREPERRFAGWAADKTAAPPKPADPFDPAAFNRQMHPTPKPADPKR